MFMPSRTQTNILNPIPDSNNMSIVFLRGACFEQQDLKGQFHWMNAYFLYTLLMFYHCLLKFYVAHSTESFVLRHIVVVYEQHSVYSSVGAILFRSNGIFYSFEYYYT